MSPPEPRTGYEWFTPQENGKKKKEAYTSDSDSVQQRELAMIKEQHKNTKITHIVGKNSVVHQKHLRCQSDDDTMAEFWKAERDEAMQNLKSLKLVIKQG